MPPRPPSVAPTSEGEPEAETDHDEAASAADEGETSGRPPQPGPRSPGEERPDAVADQGDHHGCEAQDEELDGDVPIGAGDELGQGRSEQDDRLRVGGSDHESVAEDPAGPLADDLSLQGTVE